MQINDIPFGTNRWASVEATTHRGDTGVADLADPPVRRHPGAAGGIFAGAIWRTTGARRVTSCSASMASWGPILPMGRSFTADRPGMSYQVADGAEPHRSHNREGCAAVYCGLMDGDERSTEQSRREDRRKV